SLTQPLLKDFGPSVTNARIRVAEIESKGALASSLEVESNVVVEGILGYLDLIVAQQRVTAAQERIRNGERLLSEAQALARQGRLAEADVWEVESALDRYRSAYSESEHARYERANKLATMVLRVNKDAAAQLRAVDSLPGTFPTAPSLETALQVAMDRREDLRRAKLDLEREGIQLAYAKNQRLPRLDLVATYGINGLEYSASRALGYSRMEDYPNWTLGLQLTFPLENRQAKADFSAASLRQKDALLALKALEVGIANDVDTSLKLRQSALERWGWWQASATREVRHVTVEREKFRAGRSDIREVLLREERLINAQLAAIEQQASVVKAEALLQASQGILLEKYGQ
ncbi:MAG: TolC family protein, partial [Burkholderiaceae bacterium]